MKKNTLGIVSLFFLLVFFDQLTKGIIRLYDGFYICNKGIAFGLDLSGFLFWPVWLVSLGVVAWYFFKNEKYSYLLIFILAGAFSNFIDRIYLGCVVDFIDIKIFNYPFFNLADVFIVVGAILVIVKSSNFKIKNLY